MVDPPGWVTPSHPAPVDAAGSRQRLGKSELSMNRTIYDVSFRGVASDLILAEFADVEVSVVGVVTTLRTIVEDITTLYSLIERVEALGLELLEVHAVTGSVEPPTVGT